MKKGIVAGLIVLCVALGAGTAAVVVTDDRKGPEILNRSQKNPAQ